MSIGQFDESKVNRTPSGKFDTKVHPETPLGPGGVDLSTRPAERRNNPLTPRDVEILVENKGCFENGYTPEDADKVLSMFESANLYVFWEYNDDYGLGGDSFFAGHPSGSQASGALGVGRAVPYSPGFDQYRNIHPQVWEYLSDPDSDIDPEQIPSLLEEETAGINAGELYTFSIGMSEQYAFADQVADEPVCEICGDETDEKDRHGTLMCLDCQEDEDDICDADGCEASLSDGEGYDGYCGTHADKVENHAEGHHAGKNRDPDCPEC